MNKTKRKLIVTAAIAGLLTGVAVKSYADDKSTSSSTNSSGSSASSSDSSKSSCKGKGGCKSVQAKP